jgi:hypothetical protein
MFYRENGQFKTSYQADQQIFPIVQDRWFILALLLLAFVGRAVLRHRLHVQRHLDSLCHHGHGGGWRECLGWLLRSNFFGIGRIHGGGCLWRLQLLRPHARDAFGPGA